jgi:hypothetical protein
MDKSRIFIASSGRTLVLAEMLRNELSSDFCEATLWSEEGRGQPGQVIIEMLEDVAARYDFAIIILSKDDVMIGGKDETLKARDNCVFEAGLFMSAIGRRRCFLVNSVRQSDLPSDLNGIISIPFEEPANLSDRSECAHAIITAAAQIKTSVQQTGPSASHARLPLLSIDEFFRLERPRSEGGDLVDGQVVVLDTQPWGDVERAEQVRRNMENGTSYHYFLHFSDDTVEKICQALQVIVLAGIAGVAGAADYRSRVNTIRNNKDRVLDDLRGLCRNGLLRIALLVDIPTVCYRVHNASNSALAKLYTKYHEEGFVQWTEGQSATTLWSVLPKFLEEDKADRLFLSLKHLAFGDEPRRRLEALLTRGLGRYFPGMEPEVKQICLGSKS